MKKGYKIFFYTSTFTLTMSLGNFAKQSEDRYRYLKSVTVGGGDAKKQIEREKGRIKPVS